MITKIGAVTLQEWQPGQWRIRYSDPASRKDIRLRLDAGTFAEAVADAEKHNRYCRGELEIAPHVQLEQKRAARSMSVRDAMLKSECELRCGKIALARHHADGVRFAEFCEEKGVHSWANVSRELIRAYHESLKACDLAFDSIRHLLIPVRVASRYWSLESNEFSDEFALARIKNKRPDAWEKEINALSLDTVKAFLAWLKDNVPPRFYHMAMIGFYTGARQLEIASLRPCDIDSKALEITFTDTDSHELKNAGSKRTVPVPRQVIEALTVRPMNSTDLMFVTKGGSPYDANKVSKEWRPILAAARDNDSLRLPEWFTAKVMRQTFASLAGESGVPELHLQRVLGHAPSNVLRRHYRAIKTTELSKILAVFWQDLNSAPSKTNKTNAV